MEMSLGAPSRLVLDDPDAPCFASASFSLETVSKAKVRAMDQVLSPRQQEIIGIARLQGRVNVDELASSANKG
jgi:hypothetical protein